MEIYFDGNKKVNALVNGFTVKTDQSPQGGGEGTAPEPFTLFLASLGTCAGIYVKSFCDQRQLPADDIRLFQSIEYDQFKRMIGKINLEIRVPASFPEKYHDALVSTASLCAVKKHLHPDIEFDVRVVA
ncbi:MAG TPA: OsmC family protein [Bacteroidales bacterium]|nr:OsmC family protein [Bacteroidales bacterium]HRZ47765.1 OsmC family protein [Bacteroidales bacterium]